MIHSLRNAKLVCSALLRVQSLHEKFCSSLSSTEDPFIDYSPIKIDHGARQIEVKGFDKRKMHDELCGL